MLLAVMAVLLFVLVYGSVVAFISDRKYDALEQEYDRLRWEEIRDGIRKLSRRGE